MVQFSKSEIEKILYSKLDSWLCSFTETRGSATPLPENTEPLPTGGPIQLPQIENLPSATNKPIREDIIDHLVISGGAIVSLLSGEIPNDYDIYVDDVHVARSLFAYFAKVEQTYTDQRNITFTFTVEAKEESKKYIWKDSQGKEISDRPGIIILKNIQTENPLLSDSNSKYPPKHYHLRVYEDAYYGKPIAGHEHVLTKSQRKQLQFPHYSMEHISSHAITFSDNIQIMTYCGSPFHFQQNFDFAHCLSYYNTRTGLVLNKLSLECILTKTLLYLNSSFPLSTLFRVQKFQQRGWSISKTEWLKIIYDINNLDLSDPDQWNIHVPDKFHSLTNCHLISREVFFKYLADLFEV